MFNKCLPRSCTDDLPVNRRTALYIGSFLRLPRLTEASGGGEFTARREGGLPPIVRTIGLAGRYEYVHTYGPHRWPAFRNALESISGGSPGHNIQVELYPKERFKGYSTPYYKHFLPQLRVDRMRAEHLERRTKTYTNHIRTNL